MKMDDLGCNPHSRKHPNRISMGVKKTNGILMDSGIILDMNKTEIQYDINGIVVGLQWD